MAVVAGWLGGWVAGVARQMMQCGVLRIPHRVGAQGSRSSESRYALFFGLMI